MARLASHPLASLSLSLGLLLLAGPAARAQASLTAGPMHLSIDARGTLSGLASTTTGRDYLAADTTAPFLTIVSDGRRFAPSSLSSSRSANATLLTFRYAAIGAQVTVRARATANYLVLEVTSVAPADRIHAIIWGPYPTTIGATVGEIIGVVRDGTTAVGLQVLNARTLGGDLPNREGSTWARGIAATTRTFGSSIQAYSINRARPRTVDAWGGVYKDMPVAPIPGETVVGSAIALFTCAEPAVLDVLERIERDEGLPHPTIKGTWYRRSPVFERSYLISSFGESEVDEMLDATQRAGLMSLYHEGPFKSWGHFVLDSAQWPSGRRGFKAAADKAHARGLYLGAHFLTNFINTNDPYVTPVPDARLAVTGTTRLIAAISATQRTIEVAAPTLFTDAEHDNLHTVRIGTELIQYRAVTTAPPYQLLDCQRGAFGTAASTHAAGDTVGKLFDHPYNVFFPNFEMQREVARNLAVFLNETGVDHLDFDGHEGALASGQGDYALEVFANDVRTQVHHDLIMGTSISKTFYWHTGTYYNWGEPWNGGFTESMQQYRIDNQALFDRNYMPHMLGWYLLTERTTLAEMEWMLARAAGYGAGFAMVARPAALRANANSPALLDAIREWERARMAHAFTPSQRARLKDPRNEFHLTPAGPDAWTLTPTLESPAFTHARTEREPGEPAASTFTFEQPWAEQPLQFRLVAQGTAGSASRIVLRVDGYLAIELPVELRAGERLATDGASAVQVYDDKGKPAGRVPLAAPLPRLAPGRHTLTLDARFGREGSPSLVLQLRGLGTPEPVQR